MDYIEELISSGIPLTEKAIQVHGHKENGVNYCVISHFKNGDFIQSKIEHMVTDALDSLNLNKNRMKVRPVWIWIRERKYSIVLG